MSSEQADDKVVLLSRRRDTTSLEAALEALDLKFSAHFREQARLLQEMNTDLKSQVVRLLRGMERLLGEVDGVRTGQNDEAFARVAGDGAPSDLPTVSADSALFYTMTSAKIGQRLDFNATEVGHLLGAKGLRWSGDGQYQEIGRWEKGHMRYWHRDVAGRLCKILTENEPSDFGITSKVAISMFARWKRRLTANRTEPDEAAKLES